MYNKIIASDIDALAAIAGAGNVLYGSQISADYAHDELGDVERMPEALVRVQSTEQVSAVMKHAWERNIPVTLRQVIIPTLTDNADSVLALRRLAKCHPFRKQHSVEYDPVP